MSSQFPPGHIHLLHCGILHRLQAGVCCPVGFLRQGDNLLHHDLLHRLQGNLCYHTWNTSSPFVISDLGVCRAIPFLMLFSLLLTVCTVLFPFLNTLSQRCQPFLVQGPEAPAVCQLKRAGTSMAGATPALISSFHMYTDLHAHFLL